MCYRRGRGRGGSAWLDSTRPCRSQSLQRVAKGSGEMRCGLWGDVCVSSKRGRAREEVDGGEEGLSLIGTSGG